MQAGKGVATLFLTSLQSCWKTLARGKTRAATGCSGSRGSLWACIRVFTRMVRSMVAG